VSPLKIRRKLGHSAKLHWGPYKFNNLHGSTITARITQWQPRENKVLSFDCVKWHFVSERDN
jgi:hypothetical protein